MKIYITGIAGFLGSHLAKKLKDQGHEVGGNDNLILGEMENLPKDISFHKTDCCDYDEMLKNLNIDYIDEGMIQFLKSERIIPPYQTRGYKLVELVRIYEVKD